MSGCPDWHLLDSLYGSNYHRGEREPEFINEDV